MSELQNNDFEIPYFAEYMFCLDNTSEKMSKFDKVVDIRIVGSDSGSWIIIWLIYRGGFQ